MSQLPLPFAHMPQFERGDFLWADSNEAARAWLARPDEWPQHRLALWGEAGCGKTHLLRRWAAGAGAALIEGPDLVAVPADPRPVAIDDGDRCAEPTVLLHLLNRCAEAGCAVLLTGQAAPARWPAVLPDLTSRLRAITAVPIAPPEESLLRALLARLLAERQLILPAELQDWLRLRLPRTAAAMREAVERLDYAALAAGRRLSRRLVAAVAAELTGAPCEDLMSVAESRSPAADLR